MKKELMLFHLIQIFFQYFYVLIQEIVKANLCVLKIIISPEIQPEPALVYFGTDLQSELSVSAYIAWIVNWQRAWRTRYLWNC